MLEKWWVLNSPSSFASKFPEYSDEQIAVNEQNHTLQFLLLNKFFCKDLSNTTFELGMSDQYWTFLSPSGSAYSAPFILEGEWRGG